MPEYARAGAGFVAAAAPLPWLGDTPVAFLIIALLALAFAAYGISTAIRQRTIVEADDIGLATEGFRRTALRWEDLTGLELRYYSVRRDRQKGWMQLRLSATGTRIILDSALDGFLEVTRRAAETAMRKGLPLSDTTGSNLRALGVGPLEPAVPERAVRS